MEVVTTVGGVSPKRNCVINSSEQKKPEEFWFDLPCLVSEQKIEDQLLSYDSEFELLRSEVYSVDHVAGPKVLDHDDNDDDDGKSFSLKLDFEIFQSEVSKVDCINLMSSLSSTLGMVHSYSEPALPTVASPLVSCSAPPHCETFAEEWDRKSRTLAPWESCRLTLLDC